ncbi:hypothetical protein Tcan_00682, partial [Toxocara canis]
MSSQRQTQNLNSECVKSSVGALNTKLIDDFEESALFAKFFSNVFKADNNVTHSLDVRITVALQDTSTDFAIVVKAIYTRYKISSTSDGVPSLVLKRVFDGVCCS